MTSMEPKISRRDFLKLAGLLPLGLAAARPRRGNTTAGRPNVIVVVFDAWSASNVSLYGYPRQTTPVIDELAKRAIVYHNHYAASNYTTSGTASLLTGTLPWTHRALQPGRPVLDSQAAHNIFRVLDAYYRASYTHNDWVQRLLRQFSVSIEELVPVQKLFLAQYDRFIDTLFGNDTDIASVAWARNIRQQDGYSYSLFLSSIYSALVNRTTRAFRKLFPRGLPRPSLAGGGDFLLETAIDWTGQLVQAIPQPFFTYFHFLPPHDPYHTSLAFFNRFKDDSYLPLAKPQDALALRPITDQYLRQQRRQYDEYILYVDAEFGRFYQGLEQAGLLENTWLILTSDHGELFERSILGHVTEVLYQSLVRVPLLVFEPGRTERIDVNAPTSAIDLLPTVAQLTGHSIPTWAEGQVLPPFGSMPNPERTRYAVRAVHNEAEAPLAHVSVSLLRGRYKLHYYLGYPELGVNELVKLYDLEADPEEMTDLSASQKDVADALLREVKAKLDEVNKPYA